MSKYSTWIEIDVARLRDNLSAVQKSVGVDKKIMAIVKANAYGHGGVAVARCVDSHVDAFGVANVNEGFELRDVGITKPILILGLCTPAEYAIAIQRDIAITVSSMAMAEAISDLAVRQEVDACVHIKVDTGMGRLGFPYRNAYDAIQRVVQLPRLHVDGIFSHFSLADDEDSEFTEKQIDLFSLLLDELSKKGITFPHVHVANSAGIVHPAHTEDFTMVRPGLTLYGYHVSTFSKAQLQLKPVLSLKSKVLFMKTVEKGKGVSYGRNFVAVNETRIAVLPIGYSHGLPYQLSGKMEVLCKGKRYPVVGSICMDYTMIDVGADDDVDIGDEMVFIGESGSEVITADDLAQAAETISYEVLTRLNAHIPRMFING